MKQNGVQFTASPDPVVNPYTNSPRVVAHPRAPARPLGALCFNVRTRTSAAHHLLLAFAAFGTRERPVCEAQRRNIQMALGWSPRTFFRALAELVDLHAVEVVKRAGKGGRQSGSYYTITPAGAPQIQWTKPQPTLAMGPIRASNPDTTRTPPYATRDIGPYATGGTPKSSIEESVAPAAPDRRATGAGALSVVPKSTEAPGGASPPPIPPAPPAESTTKKATKKALVMADAQSKLRARVEADSGLATPDEVSPHLATMRATMKALGLDPDNPAKGKRNRQARKRHQTPDETWTAPFPELGVDADPLKPREDDGS